jgi:hypothetical protein
MGAGMRSRTSSCLDYHSSRIYFGQTLRYPSFPNSQRISFPRYKRAFDAPSHRDRLYFDGNTPDKTAPTMEKAQFTPKMRGFMLFLRFFAYFTLSSLDNSR